MTHGHGNGSGRNQRRTLMDMVENCSKYVIFSIRNLGKVAMSVPLAQILYIDYPKKIT